MTHAGDVRVYPDADAVAHALANLFAEIARESIVNRGSFTVALAGGNTPRAAYALLAQEPLHSAISWENVHVYFGDERCVPPGDAQSNYRMASEAFLDRVPIPKKNVHRMQGEIEPAKAAELYADELRRELGERPTLDLVMLGMGADGHTASLFPGADPMTDDDALVRGVYAQSQAMWRITLTPKTINAARTVTFAVEGDQKAATLAAVLEGAYEPTLLPSQAVRPVDGRLIWLTDTAAASRLERAQ